MELQCCFCKYICANAEYDDMLDCELAMEETAKPKCYINNFDKFELETNEKICVQYLTYWLKDFGASHSVQPEMPTDDYIKSLLGEKK